MRFDHRSTRTTRRTVAVLAGASLLAAACGDDLSEGEVGAAPSPPVVPIVAADYLVEGPATAIAPGAVTFELTNNGEDFHHLQVWKVDDADAAATAIEAGDLGPLANGQAVGGVGAIEGDGTVGRLATVVDPGEYVIFCLIHTPPGAHNELGMVSTLEVAGEPVANDLPAASHQLTITSDGFDLPADWDGQAPLSVINDNGAPADAEFLRLVNGATRADFFSFLAGTAPGPPPFRVAGGVSGLGPGATAVVLDPLEPGDYLVASFSPDPAAEMAPQFTTGHLVELTIG